jgi:predicted ribosome quality control (RQC) complex YloA/Tae2 family protein
LPSEAKLALLEEQALLLQQFAYLLESEAESLLISSEQSGSEQDVEITVDPHKSRGENIAAAFAAVKKTKKQRLLGLPRLEQTRKNCEDLARALERLRADQLSDSAVQIILTKFRLGEAPSTSHQPAVVREERSPFKTFQLAEGALAFVGKSARDNDGLTKKAKANDWWFHALGAEGSHVIVPYKSLPGGKLSQLIKKQAALLALHNSRLRTDFGGEVYVTTRQHLRKKAGMAPGKWEVLKSESFYVKYSEEELKQLLALP